METSDDQNTTKKMHRITMMAFHKWRGTSVHLLIFRDKADILKSSNLTGQAIEYVVATDNLSHSKKNMHNK